MYYDYAAGKVSADDSTGLAEPYLVFNEVKLYEPFWRTSYKDFAMIRKGDNYVTSKLATAKYGERSDQTGIAANPAHPDYPYRMDGIAPRLFKTNIGDIYTTNMVEADDAAAGTTVTYAVGNKLVPVKTSANTLQLQKYSGSGDPTGMVWVVVKVYTMPDGQDGLKLQRVQ